MHGNIPFLTDSLNATIQITESKEFGASKLLLLIAQKLGLDRIIYSRKVQWREDILALVVGKLIFPLSVSSLANFYENTMLWELCGHVANEKPNTVKHLYTPLIKLLSKQDVIQKKLAYKHLKNGSAILYDLTPSESEEWTAGLLTNLKGCPFGIEFFSKNIGKEERINAVVDKYNLKLLYQICDSPLKNEKEIKTLFQSPKQKEPTNTLSLIDAQPILFQMEKNFKNFSSDNCIPSDLFRPYMLIGMLTSYLEWHMIKELRDFLKKDNKNEEKDWTLDTVIERSKSIRSQNVQLKNTAIDNLKNKLNDEQCRIILAFGLCPELFFS